MRLLFACLCVIIPVIATGQSLLRGMVKNADTREALAFATVALKNSQRGVITNAEGVFRIAHENNQDSLVISYLGYQTKVLSVKAVQQQSTIFLTPSDYELAEIVVRPGDEYLYKIVTRCRAYLKSVPTYSAKTFMEVNTNQQGQPMELVQCYFNGQFTGGLVDDLKLKTGRVGLARYKNDYFVSLGTSQAITRLHLLDKNSLFPVNPLQFSKRKLRKRYRLEEIPSPSNDDLIHIKFTPKNKVDAAFAGELWIDRKTNALLNIKCEIENPLVHPFELLRDLDELDRLKLELSQTYQLTGGQHRLTHLNFNYEIRYFSSEEQGAAKEIATKGLLFVYDYDQPFVLPLYDYAPEHHDYRKIFFFLISPSFGQGKTLWNSQKSNRHSWTIFGKRGN